MALWEQILGIIISDGVFAVLFVWLLFYVMRDSKSREKNYQQMIADLSKHLQIINEVKTQVCELKGLIGRKKRKNTEAHSCQNNGLKEYEKVYQKSDIENK